MRHKLIPIEGYPLKFSYIKYKIHDGKFYIFDQREVYNDDIRMMKKIAKQRRHSEKK